MPADQFSEKTVLLLNHTHYLNQPSGDELVLDSSLKSNSSTKGVFYKSLWSNLVESVLQYCRVVFDIFSTHKPISLVTFDDEEKIHSIWLSEDQNIETLSNIFAQEGPPKVSAIDLARCHTLPGMTSVCSMLQMLTPKQKEENSERNDGRVIVLGVSMESQLRLWIPHIISCLEKSVAAVNHSPITSSEWIFIDLFPSSELHFEDNELLPKAIEFPEQLNRQHRFFYHKLQGTSQELCRGLMRLAETHYNLASTLVQDIPMKEEANTNSSSTMYGVELLHQAEVFELLEYAGLLDKLLLRSRNGESELKKQSIARPNSGFSKTIGIKWVTPKALDPNILRFSTAAYRVTLADVGNRASICLAQFVLGGRSVALAHRVQTSFPAVPKELSFGNSLVSTDESLLLTRHDSVIYLHVLATIFPLVHPIMMPLRPPTAQPNPTDYRVQAFIDQILRPSRLAPASARLNYSVLPRERAQQHLERATRYWPLTESQSLLGKNKLTSTLFEHLPKEYLEPNEITACEEVIQKLIANIKQQIFVNNTRKVSVKRGTTLNVSVTTNAQSDAILLATELDYILSLYSDISHEHEQLWNFWRQTVNTYKSEDAPCSAEEKPATGNLYEFIRAARMIACNLDDEGNSILPQTVAKSIRNLKLLCKRLRLDSESRGRLTNTINNNNKRSVDAPRDFVSIQPADRITFIELLQPKKRSRMDTGKPDFVGLLTADSKGLCQLYRSLKEKEKTLT